MTIITKDRGSYIQESKFDRDRFYRFIDEIVNDSIKEFDKKDIEILKDKVTDDVIERTCIEADKLFDLIIRYTNDMISKEKPHFSYLSASALRRKLYKQASKNRGFDYHKGYGDYYSFVIQMTEQGLYADILESYSEKELRKAGKLIDKDKDKLFSYAGLYLMRETYLIKGYNEEILELPQERYLTSALYLLKDEKKTKRMDLVKEAYWALSNQYVGLATPTLKSSGAPHGTLSSCHEIVWNDDLYNIFDVEQQTARFSQNGAGIGVYGGYLRSDGSWIRGLKGRATGIIHPSRSMSVLAEYVNQLNTRVAGIAIYLPVWHADIFEFLDLRLKTGSQERRAHSIKTAVCIPDEFMRRIRDGKTFTIFDPYEVKKKIGIDINALWDEKKLKDGEEPNEVDHAFTYWYRYVETQDLELSKTVQAKEIYKSIYIARKTGGTPYMYYSDTAARMNPNAHKGKPHGSNLCSEIVQNQSPDELIEESFDEETGLVITKIKSGDLVTCNLSSLVLPNVFGKNKEEVDLERVINIQVRLLDNVISLNRTVVPQATLTNRRYRAVGLGAMGLATLLADEEIHWDTIGAYKYVDSIFEKIMKFTIKASHNLAVEKGSYPYFKGSDWQTGKFFEKRNLDSDEWKEIKKMASKGMRNGYLSAIAPTSSNSLMMGVSPSTDPLFDVIYNESKSGMNVLVVPPNYNKETEKYYKSGFEMDEMWSINIVAAIQKYVDQAISHNMHVAKTIKASEMLRLDMGVWNKGVKTTYYTYTSGSGLPEGCTMCES